MGFAIYPVLIVKGEKENFIEERERERERERESWRERGRERGRAGERESSVGMFPCSTSKEKKKKT